MTKLSVVLATRNEEKNIGRCLDAVKEIADEIIVVDEFSTDRTAEVAESYGAKVFKVKHEPIFHKTKEKALNWATGDWILQLDADEVVTPGLANEILKVTKLQSDEVTKYQNDQKKKFQNKHKLFERHQREVEKRDGPIGKKTGDLPAGSQEIAGFFIPRKNFFLGKPLVYAGAYPDGVIRLVKKGKARFPGKSVHEQIILDGEVGWLFNDLEHHDTPTLKRYFTRMNRYTDLQAQELREQKVPTNSLFIIHYSLSKPLAVFLNLYLRHAGFLDGVRGFLWSFFSALHFPIAYFKYLTDNSKR